MLKISQNFPSERYAYTYTYTERYTFSSNNYNYKELRNSNNLLDCSMIFIWHLMLNKHGRDEKKIGGNRNVVLQKDAQTSMDEASNQRDSYK